MSFRNVLVRRWAPILALAATVFLGAEANAQQDPPKLTPGKIQKRTYDFKEASKEMDYALFVPTKYDKDKKTPLIVALHGLGGNPQQILGYKGFTDLAEKYGYILVAPMGYNSAGWYGIKGPGMAKGGPENLSELSEKDVMNVLALVRKDFNVDDNRIYLMGHSMGGGGTWHLGIKYPEIWAGLGPIAPAIFKNPDNLDKIKAIPVILVQGDKDNLVPVAGARKWADKMKELKMTYEYIEVPGGDHVTVAFQNLPKIVEFFNGHSKQQAAKPADAKRAVYDEKADAKQLIATALAAAKRENRRVLIQWGGNWCSWCILLHDRFKSDKGLAKTLRYEYDVVYIDSKNTELAAKYNADLKKNGVPYLTVLDADGKVLANQATEPFETKVDGKNGHDPKKLQEFLTAHQAEALKAEEVLAAGLAEAAKSDRKVFLHFGAPWCGWCLKLDAWLVRPDVQTVFGKDFVDVHIDVDRMTGGKEILARFRKSDQGGIPWFAMLDAKGKAVVTSDGPAGNIGFPATPAEIAYFVTMMNASKSRLTEREIAGLRDSLAPAPKAGPGQ